MAAYGGIEASQDDIVFPYDASLAAARGLWAAAGKLRAAMTSRVGLADHARIDWKGNHRTTFDTKMNDEHDDVTTVANGCEQLALDIAAQCAKARGEQNRINWARYVDHEISDDGWGENAVEWVSGEDDYGDPPGDPATPSSPDFATTANWRIHTEFGP